jgi:hypothetical protein
MCLLLRIRCSRARCGPDRAVMLADTKQQAGKLICARVCARDAAGHAETGETQKAWDDLMPQVCRGQRGDRRLSETRETDVVRLITQRSRVQIPPPLLVPQVKALSRQREGLCVTWHVTRAGARAAGQGSASETGWHGARQRGTWWTFPPAISGRLAQRYRKCIPVSPFVLD